MSKHKQSSGDSSRERCLYLKDIPENQRIKSEVQIIRTGHLGEQSYKNVTMKLKGKIIYSRDL